MTTLPEQTAAEAQPALAPGSKPELSSARAALLGSALCLFAAFGYASVNMILRHLVTPGSEVDRIWTLCVKESVTVLIIGPWLLLALGRGRIRLPSKRAIGALVLVGLAVQLVGNVGAIWALGVVGLAIAMPVVQGACLIASAVMGWLILREPTHWRSFVAIALLVVAIFFLQVGAGSGLRGANATPLQIVLAVVLCVATGTTYAMLGVAIRRTVRVATSPFVIMCIITGVGAVSLGAVGSWRTGIDALTATEPVHFGWMIAAGFMNLAAFLGITLGLKLTTVVRANIMTASQVAMGALAGWFLFAEDISTAGLIGVGLTVTGILISDRG